MPSDAGKIEEVRRMIAEGQHNKTISIALDCDPDYVAHVRYRDRKRQGVKIGKGNGQRVDAKK